MRFVVGGLVAAAFWIVGFACLFAPERIQRTAKDPHRGTLWAGAAGRVFDSKAYLAMLRVIGVASLGAAMALTAGMILFALGYLEP